MLSIGVSTAICAQFDILCCNIKNLEHTVILQQGNKMTAQDAARLRALQSKIKQKDLDEDQFTFPFCDEQLEDLDDLPPNAAELKTNPTAYMHQTHYSTHDSRNVAVLLEGYIRHHQHLIHCSEKLENMLNPICLCKFLVSTIQLCILAMNVLRVQHTWSKNMSEMLYLIAVTIDTFTNAHSGQILINQVSCVDCFRTTWVGFSHMLYYLHTHTERSSS